jgi:hypothetical protein
MVDFLLRRPSRAPTSVQAGRRPATALLTAATIAGGGAGVVRRLRVVLDPELHGLRNLGTGLASDQVKRHVDTRRHARRGDRLAVLDEAPADRVGAEVAQLVEEAQWQVARLPSSSPAAPSTSEPVQTSSPSRPIRSDIDRGGAG